MNTRIVTGLLTAALLAAAAPVLAHAQEVHIAVLAHRGEGMAATAWQPTADYLTRAIPGRRFVIVPLMNSTLPPAVAEGRVDFVITNPGSYAGLEANYGATRMLTLRNLRQGYPHTRFGAVIFTRADRTDIDTLADLRGKSFMGVNRDAFGGFQMAWREFRLAGIEPDRDFARVAFSGLPQDNIVYAVRDGKIDAGTVRTDTLERMAEEGRIVLRDFKIINQQQVAGFPFLLSTHLYPEWAFARLSHVDEQLAQQVVVALLQLTPDSRAARASQSAGWTVPLDYTPVHELFRELRLGPYRDLGKMGMADFVRQYWSWLVAVVGAFLLLVLAIAYVLRINMRLNLAQESLIDMTLRLESSNRTLEQLSFRDGLTGLANHRHFEEVLTTEWARSERAHLCVGLLMIDIDFFKQHNDRYGHPAGDQCLREVAAVLKSTVHRPADLAARYGGEEFSVILPDTDIDGAMAVGERVRRAVEALRLDHCEPGTAPHVTVSVGVASMAPQRGQPLRTLTAAADRALYRAKDAGRNRVIAASAEPPVRIVKPG
jgi:diguanylate cyclase (GGDEF)-like protein